MKNRKKKLLFALSAACVILVAVSGTLLIHHKKDTSSHKYEEPLVIDVFDPLANYQGIQSGWFAKIVKEKFNMELNIIAPNVSGGDTLYQTRMAAGNLGDLVICKGTDSNLQNLVTAGMIIDMSPYLKDKQIMQYNKAIQSLNAPVSEDAIYAIPGSISSQSADTPGESSEPTFGPYLRYDIYASIGYPEIKDLDSLLDVLNEMQKAYPTSESGKPTYCFSFFKDWDGNMMVAAKQPACFYGYDEYGFVFRKADGTDYQSIMDDHSFYLRNLKLYFDANQLGLVDPDSPNQSYYEMYNKYEQGDILYSPWPWLGQSAYNTLARRTSGRGFKFVPIEDMQILLQGCNPYGDNSTVMAIGSKAKDPERIADFIDWLYSPEGIYANSAQSVTGTAGPEGMTWEMTDQGPTLTKLGESALLGTDAELDEQWGGGTFSSGRSEINFVTVALSDIAPNGYPYQYTKWKSYQDMEDTTLENAWKNHMHADSTLNYLLDNNQYVVLPGTSYQAPAETNEIATIRNQCRSIIVDTSWKMVFAKDEATFYSLQKEMQTAVRNLGYDKVLAIDMDKAKKDMDSRLSNATQK